MAGWLLLVASLRFARVAMLFPIMLASPVMAAETKPTPGVLMSVRAVVQGTDVKLSFYQSTRFWVEQPEKSKSGALVIRIYRQEIPNLQFGVDYEEILNGLDPKQGRVIWDAPLPAINVRKYEFTDTTTEIGKTYVYWVSSNLGDTPTGPVPARVRDPETFWNQQEIERRMDALVKTYPQLVTKKLVGTTVLGRPIHALLVGSQEKRVAMIGSVHAGESGPELILPVIEKLLQENPDVLAKVGLAAIPIVNIDERERLAAGYPYYLRKNAAGVDINRNFDALWGELSYLYGLMSSDPVSDTYFGPAPSSEPETRAVEDFLREHRPLAAFSYHHVAALTGTDLLRSAASADDAAFTAKCEAVAKAYVEGGVGATPGPYSRLLCTGGSIATWLWKNYGIPGYDVEGKELAPLGDMTTHEQLARFQGIHTRAILGTLRHFEQTR